MYFVLEQVLKRGVDWWDRKAGGMVEAVPRRSGVQKAIQYTWHGVKNCVLVEVYICVHP